MTENLLPPVDTPDSLILERLLVNRHSCRGFHAEYVPMEVQRRILEIAQRSASWCNAQPWQVHVTQGRATEELKRRMLAAFDDAASYERRPDYEWPQTYLGVYRQRRLDCAMQLYQQVGVPMGDRAASARQARENFKFFGAPHVAIITSDKSLGVYGAVDCGAYVANFLLAAASFGISAIPQAALASQPGVIRKFFEMDESRSVVCGISFGYEDATHPANGFRTSRASLDDVVSFIHS